jgi:hypothetical protein
MFSWFKKQPHFVDQEFEDLALMLTLDEENPTFFRERLDRAQLDFSLDSLNQIDSFLEAVREDPPDGDDYFRLVIRVGAYVGQVMRTQRPGKFRWISHKEAAKHSEFVRGFDFSLSSVGILWCGPEKMCFPLGKVVKFLENGSEDSLYFFAKVLMDD